MWGSTKGRSATNKLLTRLVEKQPFRSKSRRTKGGAVAKITRDEYGSANDWFALCKEVKARDRWCCVKCMIPEDPSEGLYHEVHHIRALSRGGSTAKANLVTLCKRCHGKRHKHLGRST